MPMSPPRDRSVLIPVITVVVVSVATAGYYGREAVQARLAARAAGHLRHQAALAEAERSRQCQENLRRIGEAVLAYARDRNQSLPRADNWTGDLMPYVKDREVFVCPSRPELPVGYAFNGNLSGRSLRDIRDPAGTVLAFESSSGGPNPADTGGSWMSGGPHGSNQVLFCDGHVASLQDIPARPEAWAAYLPGARYTPPPLKLGPE